MNEQQHLTDEQINIIAEKAAEKALEKVYTQVGKSIVTKFLWIVGSIALGFAAAKGWFVPSLK